MKTKSNRFLRSALLTTLAFAGVANHAQSATNTYQWNGTTSTSWAIGTNWSASPGVGATGGLSDSRLNVYNGTGQTLIYSAAQGTTVYASSGRGLVISSATGVIAGSMEITGGSFSTLGSTSADIIGNAATGNLTVSGGSFIGAGTSAGGTILGLNSGNWISTLTVSGTGSATFTRLQMSAGTTTVSLNGGTLTADQIVDVDNSGVTANSNTTFNFNGGTLTAGSGAVTAFMTGLSNAYVLSGGAKINTNGKDITIGQVLLHDPALGLTPDGGLAKSGAGTMTLSSTSTYTGATNVDAGKLVINGNISTSSLTTVRSGATLGGNGTVGALKVDSEAFLTPGNSLGILNTGNYDQQGTLALELNGTNAGTGYDQVNVTGSVTLSGALAATVGYTPVNDQLLFILLNDGVDAISGNFTGLVQGAEVTFGASKWLISYHADSASGTFTGTPNGNDIALKAIPEPCAALLGGLGLLALLRRRR